MTTWRDQGETPRLKYFHDPLTCSAVLIRVTCLDDSRSVVIPYRSGPVVDSSTCWGRDTGLVPPRCHAMRLRGDAGSLSEITLSRAYLWRSLKETPMSPIASLGEPTRSMCSLLACWRPAGLSVLADAIPVLSGPSIFRRPFEKSRFRRGGRDQSTLAVEEPGWPGLPSSRLG